VEKRFNVKEPTYVLIIVFLFAVTGCGLATSIQGTHIDSQNYDAAFEGAISKGLELGYTPVYEDKKRGVLQLERDRGHGSKFFLTVKFKPNGKSTDVVVSSRDTESVSAYIPDPFAAREVESMLQAVEQAK